MRVIEVKDDNQVIIIGQDLIGDIGKSITPYLQSNRVFIVTDHNVSGYYIDKLKASLLKCDIEHTVHVLQPGESSKSFGTLQSLLEEILSEGSLDNRSTIIAFGGGVIGDVAGVAASMLLRGVDLIQIPTTLLAQVDSSIGGKCAINSQYGKNLIGSLWTAKLTLIDVTLLKTVPEREFISGYSEVVKHAALYDAEFFLWLNKNLQNILDRELGALLYVIKRCCKIKLDIIKDNRAKLNFGHTIGHAIEAACNYEILHGEAVSIGIASESIASEVDISSIKDHLQKAGLPTSLVGVFNKCNIESLYSHLIRDKKVRNNTVELTFLETIGKSYTEYVSCDFMYSLLKHCLN